ncbi:MAG: ATP translocase [Gammaproteobacteria bacterium]|nr:ATP translocase [Gammaproteobacteria bacterium]
MERQYRRLNLFERFISRFAWVKPGEGRSVLLLFFGLFTLMFAYYLLKVIRDPLILKDGTAELKSYTTAGQAVVLLIIIPFFTQYFYKFSNAKDKTLFIRKVVVIFAGCLSLFAVGVAFNWSISIAFYIWLGVFSVILVSLYWSFCADCFNVKSGQRLFTIIALGGSIGAWLGALAAGWLYPLIGVLGLIFISTVLLLALATIIKASMKSIPEDAKPIDVHEKEAQKAQWHRGFGLIFKRKYLLAIASFIVILNWINSMGEYVLAKFVKQAVATSSKAPELFMTEFYSNYIGWFTLIGLALQLFVVTRLFRLIGVGASIMILPVVMMINYGVLFMLPVFTIAKWALIAENSVNYSIQNTSRHALFLPVPREEKYLSKNVIEAFFYRFGDLLYAATVFIGVTYFDLEIGGFIAFNFIMALALLGVAVYIRNANQKQLDETEPNSPPVLYCPIETQVVSPGAKTVLAIPENTFIDPDLGDAIRYRIESVNGPLPNWCQFDATNLQLELHPPEDFAEHIDIRLIAYDFEGLQADTELKIQVERPLTS